MPPHISTFDEVIAPVTRDAFLADYWSKSFLHLAGQPGRFTSLLTWDDLNHIFEQHRLSPPRFKLVQNGGFIDPDRYMVPGQPRPDLGKLVACLSQGATLVLGAVKEIVPNVQVLTRSFQKALDADNFVNLYAGWRSQKGFDVHWDAQDSIVLQLSGRKRWQIFKPTRPFPLENDIEKPARPTGPPVWDGVLEDGDALYIPRGWWHVVFPVNVPSLHLTISSTPPTGMDLLQWIIDRLRRYERIRQNLPASGDVSGQRAYIAQLRTLLLDAVGDTVIADFRKEPIVNALTLPRIRLPLAPYEQSAPLTPRTRMRLASVQRLAFDLPAGAAKAETHSGGRHWTCPAALVPVLETLSDETECSFGELCARLPDETAVANLKICITALAGAGILFLDNS